MTPSGGLAWLRALAAVLLAASSCLGARAAPLPVDDRCADAPAFAIVPA